MSEITVECNGDAVDLSMRGLRIAAIFIIMAASAFGAFTPIILARQRKMKVPKLTFFILKYIGTGVIIATAWLHLLAPAAENLGDPCLKGQLGDYPWAFAIGLWTVLLMFFVEMLATRQVDDGDGHSHGHGSDIDPELDPAMEVIKLERTPSSDDNHDDKDNNEAEDIESGRTLTDLLDQPIIPGRTNDVSYPPGGEDHLGHRHEHTEGDSQGGKLAGQLLAIFILEFGVVFHSIFIGLTLGTTSELIILLIVLVFHQMFEGLGLGSRLAIAPWPKNKQWLPYLLAMIFSLATPVGVAAGVAAQPKNANAQKLVNGIFDAISAGILMYTGLVELLAHEFMFNPYMRKASLKMLFLAFGCVAFGMVVMAVLAKWA